MNAEDCPVHMDLIDAPDNGIYYPWTCECRETGMCPECGERLNAGTCMTVSHDRGADTSDVEYCSDLECGWWDYI